MEFLKTIRGLLGDARVFFFLLPALAILALDIPVLFTLIYSLAAIGLIVALAHIGRRVLFPYIDLDMLVATAKQSPSGAGKVVQGACIVFSAIIIASVIWISR